MGTLYTKQTARSLRRLAVIGLLSLFLLAAGSASVLTLDVGSKVPVGDYGLNVTGTTGGETHSAPLTLSVSAATSSGAGFSISAPASATTLQGGIITLPVTVKGQGFADGTLSLSGSSLLSGDYGDTDKIGYTFHSVSARGGNLTLFVGAEVSEDSYTLTVSGTANGVSQRTSLTLQVNQRGQVYEIWPTGYGSYQNNIKQLRPGDVLVLHEGTYPGSAVLRLSGTQEKPIIIRGYGQGEAKPVLEYTGSTSNHWEIHGSHLIIRGLEFDSSTYSIRIRPPSSGEVADVSLIDNTFVGCGGGCISANDRHATYNDIRILANLMLDALATPVYIGNHQGNATFHNFLFEGNVIDARIIRASDVVGYGIEVKLNVENADLRNNYIVGARGPGIMTYGLERNKDPDHRAIVKGNIVIGACTDSNILIGAGPALVRDNLSMGGRSGGYGISDYNGRHLSSGIRILGNTALLNDSGGFRVKSNTRGTGLENLQMIDNLAHPSSGKAAYKNLPVDAPSAVIEDNNTASPTSVMTTDVRKLKGLIPSPQDLKLVWPMLAQGPLERSQLMHVLGTLASLPNQSSSNNPRPCP